MGFPRLDVAHIFFPHAPLLMAGRIRTPLGLLRAPFLANLASLSWGGAFLDVPNRQREQSHPPATATKRPAAAQLHSTLISFLRIGREINHS